MKPIKRAAPIGSPNNSVKQAQYTKIFVDIEFKARTNKGEPFALDWLPDAAKRLIILKIAAFEIQIESIINQSFQQGGPS